jgi:hypothetical protein
MHHIAWAGAIRVFLKFKESYTSPPTFGHSFRGQLDPLSKADYYYALNVITNINIL